jgi:surface antigen
MRKKIGIPIVVLCSALALGACENNPKTAMGGIIGGGALGGTGYLLSKGLKGGKYTAPITVASTALGALIGSGIGSALDKTDQLHHLATMQEALEINPTNTPKEWTNPKTENTGVVVPRETFKKQSGEWCRKYDYHIMHDTKVSSGKGLACRNIKTGKWETIGTPTLSTL